MKRKNPMKGAEKSVDCCLPLYNSHCDTIQGKGKGKNNKGAAPKQVAAPKEDAASESSSEDDGDNQSYPGGDSEVYLSWRKEKKRHQSLAHKPDDRRCRKEMNLL